eukprot:1143009-Pelagomonas_calceolata.AAC.4
MHPRGKANETSYAELVPGSSAGGSTCRCATDFVQAVHDCACVCTYAQCPCTQAKGSASHVHRFQGYTLTSGQQCHRVQPEPSQAKHW